MKVVLDVPRTRGEHIAGFEGPDGLDSQYLVLERDGKRLIAERDPSSSVYHVKLPGAEAGDSLVFDVSTDGSSEKAVGITFSEHANGVDVSLKGSPFFTFHHDGSNPKPFINPILTPGGVNMLREPMPAYSEGEHPWQRGLTLMQGAINGVDCWNEAEKPGFGRTEQDEMAVTAGPQSLLIASDNTWYEGDRPLMRDCRSYRLFDTDRKAAVLDISITLQAVFGQVTIGGTKEAGFLGIRVNPSMNAAAGGQMRNAYGATDEVGCWSKPAHWMDYFGPVGEEIAGFAVFDHPENFRYPTTWHARGYGLFAPNCWMFKPDHVLAEDEKMTFRWRVIVHSGDTVSAGIGDLFLDYADGLRAKWEG
jgi:hypothetical protein